MAGSPVRHVVRLASCYANSVNHFGWIGWDPFGEIQSFSLWLTEIRHRSKPNPRTPSFTFPNRLPQFIEKDYSLPQYGDKATFPAEANTTVIERFCTQLTESHISRRRFLCRHFADINTIMHLCGYGKNTWNFYVKIAKPQIYMDMLTYPESPHLLREFIMQNSRTGEKKFTKQYRVAQGNMEEHQLMCISEVLGEFHQGNYHAKTMDFFRCNQDERATIFDDREDGSPAEIYSRIIFNKCDMNVLVTFDGERVVDVESVDYPTNKLDAMEPVFERLEENFEYFNSLDDGLYIVTGKDWFVTDMELVEAYKQGSKGRWGRHDGHLSDLAMTDARNHLNSGESKAKFDMNW